ncbi:MAG: hypothetical protein U5L07_15185 [Desulfobacterales bacterium]|nr:hypothetical protein [Desulfobacterales bacterium]
MPYDFTPLKLKGLTTYSLADRKSKVSRKDFASPWQKGKSYADFLNTLPDILGSRDLKSVIHAVAAAHKNQKVVLAGMGAHVIKVGLNPIIIDLLKRNVLTGIAMNGAGIIHDFELAFAGKTSEDVAAALGDGSFGMAKETCEHLGAAIRLAADENIGLGEAVGRYINQNGFPYADQSLLAAAERLKKPATVHVAIGTDIIHMHPSFDPEAAGKATHHDFRLFAAIVAELSQGVYFNIGSAVIMPEIFLKAVSLVRNLGHAVSDLTTVNMDFIRHYRPMTNVVNRPTADHGRGINLVGHHEILLPLIAAGIIEHI